MIKGQTDRDSIIFHGNITNDMKEEEDIVKLYRYNLFCKNNPQNKTLLDTANFAIKCLRGDTIVLEVLSASPFRFQVECIAESDTPTNIHVWNFPKSYNGWHRFDNNKTERLSIKKENLVSTLTGTYQQTLCFDGEEYIWAMMKLVPDGTFEYISNIFNLDGEGGNYLTGTWNVNKDTLVCNVVSDLFPPRVQSRYDGQTLCFTYPAWENNRKEALEHDIVYKYLICETGLIETGKRKSALKKIKYRYVGKNATDAVTVHVNNQVYELTTSIDSVIHDTIPSFFHVRLARDGRLIGERNFPLTGKCPIEEEMSIEVCDKGFMIRIPYCDGYLFRIGKARFVYSHELDNFVLAAYNEEIIDRQHPGLDSRIINYDLPEKPMMLSAFSPCAVRNKTETLYYKNDTISQELIIRKINERRIYFVLSSQKTDREGKKEYKGYASISDYAYWASETDVSENGELYPVIEYWYEDEDFPLSIRVSHDYSRATISFAEELSLPFIYPLKKK